jgi:hypothetical protein
MRKILAFLLLIGFTVASSAQVVRQNSEKPGYNKPFSEPTAQQNADVPRPYDRSLAVQKLLKLSIPPTLGDAISLTPGATVVPGLAEIDFDMIQYLHNGDPVIGRDGGPAVIMHEPEIKSQPGGHAYLTFSGRAGKRYIVDCLLRTDGGNVAYSIVGDTSAVGDVYSADHHVLIATDPVRYEGSIWVSFNAVNPQASMTFTRCDIAPF